MFKSHNNKFIKYLYVNGQQNFLSRPFQPTSCESLKNCFHLEKIDLGGERVTFS